MAASPLVCAVLLTKDRPAMARRAVECFRAQAYHRKALLIWDTGGQHDLPNCTDEEKHVIAVALPGHTIGTLRNLAVMYTMYMEEPSIIIHWDDDDWSHPNRIAEQVALLQASGADCVGYREVLFWRTCGCDQVGSPVEGMCSGHHNEAWLYSSRDPRTCIGSSMCYWRAAWERRQFKDLPKPPQLLGEDKEWLMGVKSVGVSSVMWREHISSPVFQSVTQNDPKGEPRLICSIHGGNTQPYDIEANIARGATEWRRVPEWNDICRKVMTL